MVMLRELPDNFQLEQLRAALKFVKNRRCAVDVGAHRGIWTRVMAREFAKVTAVEPNIKMFEQISDDLGNVKKVNAACGSRAGRCALADGKKNTGQTHCIIGNEVEVVTIDSMNLLEVDFIKIDVEGMEFDVLKGGRNTIEQSRPLIMIEENGLCERYGHKTDRASRLLRRWGMVPLVTFHMKPEKDVNILFGWVE